MTDPQGSALVRCARPPQDGAEAQTQPTCGLLCRDALGAPPFYVGDDLVAKGLGIGASASTLRAAGNWGHLFRKSVITLSWR